MSTGRNISVVVASYEKKDILKRVLSSIEVRLESGDEIIVVDDGSSDGTQDFLLHYQSDYSYECAFLQDKGYRLATARNTGLEMASNDCIVQIDDDYLMTNRLLEKCRRLYDPEKLIVIRRDEREEDGTIRRDSRIRDSSIEKRKVGKNLFQLLPKGYPPRINAIWGMLVYSKQTIQELGGYNEAFNGNWGGEDAYLTIFDYAGYDVLYYIGSRCIHEDHTKRENRFEEQKENNKVLNRELKKLL